MASIPHHIHTGLRRKPRIAVRNIIQHHHQTRFSQSRCSLHSTTDAKTASLRMKNPPYVLSDHYQHHQHHHNHIHISQLQQHRTFTSSTPKPLHNQNLNFTYPDLTPSQISTRTAISKICTNFPESYWTNLESTHTFPHAFHAAIAQSGYLGICMPQQYGGKNQGISEAAIMLQTISESGGAYAAASAVHMNIFGLEPVRKFGSEEQKTRMLTPLIAGKEKACFGVTEPNTGLDTTRLQSFATKSEDGKHYILKGSKIWISTAQVAHKILILVRTTPLSQVRKPSQGLSLFYTDLDKTQVDVREIPKMGRAAVDSNLLFFDDWKVPVADLIGEEGNGFRMIMVGMNAERILIAAEALGIGFAALRTAARYAATTEQDRSMDFDDYGYDYEYEKEYEFDGGGGKQNQTENKTETKPDTHNEQENQKRKSRRMLGANQSIQHPLADSWMQLEAARLMVYQAARLYDSGFETGEYANAAKYLAAEAAWRCCERAVMIVGGHGTSSSASDSSNNGNNVDVGGGGDTGTSSNNNKDHNDDVATDLNNVERYLRESLIPRIAPVSREMICNYVGEKVLGLPRSY